MNERNPEYQIFRERYARARRAQAEYWADEIVECAMLANDKNAHAVRAKFDGLKWILAKLHPVKWSDRVMNVHSGSLKVETVKDHAPEWMQDMLTKPPAEASEPAPEDETGTGSSVLRAKQSIKSPKAA